MEHQQAIQFITLRDTNDRTKYGASVNSIHCSPWYKQPYQIWSISKLNSLLSVTWTTVPNMEHQRAIKFVTLCDTNDRTKYGVSVNSIHYSPWQKQPSQIWSISKLNSLLSMIRTTVPNMEHQRTIQFVTLRDMNDRTKYRASVNSLRYSPWHEQLYLALVCKYP